MSEARSKRLQREIGRGRRIGKRHTRDNHEHEQNGGHHELGKRRDAIGASSTRRMQQCAQLQRFANRARRLRHRAAHARQGASARHLACTRANHRRHRRERFFGPCRIASLARNAGPACAFAHLPTANTRVNHPVKNIRRQISAKHKHGRNHGDARQKRRISAEASRNRRLAQAGIRKNLLDKNRTAENLRDRGELQRHRRQQQIAHTVATHDLPRRQTASTGKFHIIGFKNIDELLARMQRDVRHAHE